MALLLLTVLALLAIDAMRRPYDFFDSFEVLDVQPAPDERFLTTYRHYYSESSATVRAAWLLDESPTVGSTAPPNTYDEPVLVWGEGVKLTELSWRNGRLTARAVGAFSHREGSIHDCYWDTSIDQVCYDPKQVDFIGHPSQ